MEFDDAAAQAAIDELTATREVLIEAETGRAGATTTASDDFAGVYADDYTEASGDLEGEAREILDNLLSLRSSIQDAMADAATRRSEVGAEQQEWDEEQERINQLPPGIPHE